MSNFRKNPNLRRASLSSELILLDQSRFHSRLHSPQNSAKEQFLQNASVDNPHKRPMAIQRKSVIDIAKELAKRQNRLQTLKNCVELLKSRTYTKDLLSINHQQKALLDDQGSVFMKEIQIQRRDFLSEKDKDEKEARAFPRQDTKDRFIKFIHYLIDVRVRNKIKIEGFRNKFMRIIKSTLRPTNPLIIFWNILILCVIIHNVFIVPLQDAFDSSFQTIECNNMIWLIQFEFFACIFDIIIQFNVSLMKDGNVIQKKREIAKYYIRNGLAYDFLGLVGFLANRFSFIIGTDCTQSIGLFQNLTKYAFLCKRHRFKRVASFFKQNFIHSKKAENYTQLIELLLMVIVMAHYVACYWITVAVYSHNFFPITWITAQDASSLPQYQIYLKSMYFACMTMTTVGYGDLPPRNPIEYGACICVMVFSCGFFAYTLNTITSILVDNQNQQMRYNREIETINNYMTKRKIDPHLQSRVKSYLKSIQKAGLNDDYEEEAKVILKLSSQLQEQLLLQDKGKIFQQLPVIRDNFSQEFMLKLIDKLREVRLSPDEVVSFNRLSGKPYPGGCFLYLDQGHLELIFEKQIPRKRFMKKSDEFQTLKIATIRQGGNYGVSYLFGKSDRQAIDLKIRSTGFSVLYTVHKEDFEEILKQNPDSIEAQRYSMIKTKVSLNGDMQNLNVNCILCEQSNHEFGQCPNFFMQPHVATVIKKYEYSFPMERSHFKRNKGNQKYNALSSFQKTKHEVQKYMGGDCDESQISTKKEEDENTNKNTQQLIILEVESQNEQSFANSSGLQSVAQDQIVSVHGSKTDLKQILEESVSSWNVPDSDRNNNKQPSNTQQKKSVISKQPKPQRKISNSSRNSSSELLDNPVSLENVYGKLTIETNKPKSRLSAPNMLDALSRSSPMHLAYLKSQNGGQNLSENELAPRISVNYKSRDSMLKNQRTSPLKKSFVGGQNIRPSLYYEGLRATQREQRDTLSQKTMINNQVASNQSEYREVIQQNNMFDEPEPDDCMFIEFDSMKEYPVFFPHNNFSVVVKKFIQRVKKHKTSKIVNKKVPGFERKQA